MNDLKDSDIIEGRNPVIEALKSGRSIKIIYIAAGSRGKTVDCIKSLAQSRGISVQEIEKVQLDKHSTTGAHQGVVAYVAPYTYAQIEDILEAAAQKHQDPFVLLLDGITDPHNMGAIIRTAECMGAHGIIIPKDRSIGITPAVIKASAGAVEYIHIAAVTNMAQTVERLKKDGLWIMGADMRGQPCRSMDLKGPIGLIIGSEGGGIRRLVKEKCDVLLSIPMSGHIASLNASVAAGMLMYEISMQRLDI
jgi:23S rRNA (guanosine2251-2'-O)-methyltransferase